ncbi:hypothetical protein [Gimesia panareensis]|uniref:hypothetical protein n=1 Tax=Gimesia panareensis TaxID=2527978 RepID=UPI0018D61CFA|nr:hypothetical protein [Gimesia panareensis]
MPQTHYKTLWFQHDLKNNCSSMHSVSCQLLPLLTAEKPPIANNNTFYHEFPQKQPGRKPDIISTPTMQYQQEKTCESE